MNKGIVKSASSKLLRLFLLVCMVFLLVPTGTLYAIESQTEGLTSQEQTDDAATAQEPVALGEVLTSEEIAAPHEAAAPQEATVPQEVAPQETAAPQESVAPLNITAPQAVDLTITTEAELRAFAADVNGGNTYEGKTVVLANDIALTSDWTPIGDGRYNNYVMSSFGGVFDGQGHTISEINVVNTSTNNYTQGLFGRVSGTSANRAVVKNIIAKGTVVTASRDGGGIAAYGSRADFINCGNEVNVTARDWAGGIVGNDYIDITITSCYNYGNITGTSTSEGGYYAAGGIVGTFCGTTSTITDCYNWGYISAGKYAGGLVGTWFANTADRYGAITNCYNDGSVSAPVYGNLAGKVLAYNATDFVAQHTLTNSYGVSSTTESLIGAGEAFVTITNCAVKTDVEMRDGTFATLLGDSYKAISDSLPILAWQDMATTAKHLSKASIAEIPNETYSGTAHTPEPVVTLDGITLEKGTDYSVTYAANIDAGVASVTVNGMGGYTGSKSADFTIDPRTISDGSVAAIADQAFTAPAVTPTVVLTVNGTQLVQGTDYNLSYVNNTAVATKDSASPPTVTVTGVNNYKDSLSQTFTIIKRDINDLVIVPIGDQTYDGVAVEPAITIKDGDTVLEVGIDYTVIYTNNNGIGTGTATITGVGNYEGSATRGFEIVSPYTITTEAQLKAFRDNVNQGVSYVGRTILIANDIELTSPWIPIGTANHAFDGIFDGQGHIVSAVDVNSADGYAAFFGKSSGTIRNVVLSGSVVSTDETGTEEAADIDYVAGVVGLNLGTVSRVSSTIDVSGEYLYNCGGIAGRNEGTITECENFGSVYGFQNIGGIVGTNYGSVTKSCNAGDIQCTQNYGKLGVGGIVGRNGDTEGTVTGTIDSCYNVGTVGIGNYVNGYRWEGGIAGYCNSRSSITNCYNAGLIMPGYMEYGPIVGGWDYGYQYSNNYSLEGLNTVSTSESVYGISKSADEMKAEDFITLLNGIPSSDAFKVRPSKFPLLFWQTTVVPDPKFDFTKVTTGTIEDQECTGEEVTPAATVSYRDVTLTEGIDYTVAYQNNINAGTASIVLTGMGDYFGSKTVTFTILPKAAATLSISNEEELLEFRDRVDGGYNYSGYVVTLENDIELTSSWNPIGAYSSTDKKAFAGIFDGQGHTISGIDLYTTDGGFYALFAYVQGTEGARASIKNVIVDGTFLDTNESTSSRHSAGGLAGIVGRGDYVDIENCANKASLTGSGCVAGIVSYLGYEGSTVTACHNYGTISCTAKDTDTGRMGGRYAGGIIAYLIVNNQISSCYNTGDIVSTAYAGGIVGMWYPSTSVDEPVLVENCYNTGTISTIEVPNAEIAGNYTGGIVGSVSTYGGAYSALYDKIVNCYSLDTSCELLFGCDNRDGFVTIESCLNMTGAEMKASGFAATLGNKYKDSVNTTPLLYWEFSGIIGALVADIPDQIYAGGPIEPQINVTYGGELLVAGTDYTVSFSDNIDVGTATVTITGNKDYSGTFSESFTIVPASLTVAPDTLKKRSGSEDPTLTASATGLKGEDTLASYRVTRQPGEEIADYELSIDTDSVIIKRGAVDVTQNYYISGQHGTFSITGAKVLAGDDRYATANAVVTDTYSSADGVIIACGAQFPDALAASSLGGALDYPILLTAADGLTNETLGIIRMLGAKEAIIVGGTSAVGGQVEWQLETVGLSVERLGGQSRYETAEAIYDYGCSRGTGDTSVWKSGEMILASGESFADALAISPYAAGDHVPILLANGDGAPGTSKTQELLLGCSKVIATGGTARISQDTETMLRARVPSFVRLSGADRYETSMEVARYLVGNAGFSYDKTAITTGDTFPDALVGSIKQGKNRAIMLLVNDSSLFSVSTMLKESGSSITILYYLGGPASVSDSMRQQINTSVGI